MEELHDVQLTEIKPLLTGQVNNTLSFHVTISCGVTEGQMTVLPVGTYAKSREATHRL